MLQSQHSIFGISNFQTSSIADEKSIFEMCHIRCTKTSFIYFLSAFQIYKTNKTSYNYPLLPLHFCSTNTEPRGWLTVRTKGLQHPVPHICLHSSGIEKNRHGKKNWYFHKPLMQKNEKHTISQPSKQSTCNLVHDEKLDI